MRASIVRRCGDKGNGCDTNLDSRPAGMEFRAGSISVMAAGVTMNAWPVRAVSSNGLNNLRWWRDPQAGRERQHERRDDAKSEYGEQNRQREAQYVRRAACNAPNEPGGDQTRPRGHHPAAIPNFQQRLAMRAL